MEANENPDDEELKSDRNVSYLDDDEEENDGVDEQELAGDGATIITKPTESEEFHQTDEMQCIRPKNTRQFQDEDTGFINVGLLQKMEGNGHGFFEQRKLKFSENVSLLEDEDVSDEYGAAGIPKVAEKEDEQKWTTKDKEEFYQLGDIQNLITKHVEQDQGTDKHFIGVSTPISHTSKTKLIRFLEKMPTSGTHGCITSSELCKPVNGEYAEGVQFKKKQDYSASSKRRVSKCSDLTTNRDFILKEIPRSEWNKNEAVIPIQMEHQHIAVVVGVIQRSAMWIELLLKDAGTSLEDFLRSRFPLQKKVLLDICAQGLRALSHIHLFGFIHHDVKPANITIDKRLNVRLTDFGSSRHFSEQVSTTGGWTPEYLPPECCRYLRAKEKRSKPGLTTKVDVFAFAMVMGYIVTRKHLLIGLVTPSFKYQTGQRECLRDNLMKKITENPEEIRDLISKTINNERLRALLESMSHEDIAKRDSAKEALDKVTELQQMDQQTNPKKTDRVMIEEEDENEVHSTTKRRGPALQHPCIRTQESQSDGSKNTYMLVMSQQHQLDVQKFSKMNTKGPGLEYNHMKRTKRERQVDDLKKAEALPSEGSSVLPPKYQKTNEPASGEDTLLFQASDTNCLAIHDVSEKQENDGQQMIDHNKVLQKLKTKIAGRQQQCVGETGPSGVPVSNQTQASPWSPSPVPGSTERATTFNPSPTTNGTNGNVDDDFYILSSRTTPSKSQETTERLPTDLECIQTVDLIYYNDSSKMRTAACEKGKTGGGFGNENCNNEGPNKETGAEILPRLDLLLSRDSFKE